MDSKVVKYASIKHFKIMVSFWIFVASAYEANLDTSMNPYDELYTQGIDAYWMEDWESCIFYLEKSLESFKLMQDGIIKCSKKCKGKRNFNEPKEDAATFIMTKAACQEACERKTFGDSRLYSHISEEMHTIFKSKQPYLYLQLAYIRNGNFAKSLAAANTYSLYDPDNHIMQQNMKYFLEHENTTGDMFVDLEALPHHISYRRGCEAYNLRDYKEAIIQFKDALDKFYEAENGCRALCEATYDSRDGYSDVSKSFLLQIVYHYRKVLECYLKCPVDLAKVSLKTSINNYVPKHYRYLHYAYLHAKEYKKAAGCAKAYLVFFPGSLPMKINLEKLKSFVDVEVQKIATEFHRRLIYQARLLRYIYQKFDINDGDDTLLTVYASEEVDEIAISMESDVFIPTFAEDDFQFSEQNSQSTTSTHEDEKDEANRLDFSDESQQDVMLSKDDFNGQLLQTKKQASSNDDDTEQKNDVDISFLIDTRIGRRTVDSNYLVSIEEVSSISEVPLAEGPLLFGYTRLLANSTQMAGPERFALDGMASESECQELIDLELTGGVSGDGYKGNPSPHTEHELYQGITVDRAAQLAAEGQISVGSAMLYYQLSERVRRQVKAYFKVKDELYFDYTHLVCQTATTGGKAMERHDLSQLIHGDNCVLYQDGRCIKEYPAYTWRDYSSVLYLNDDFDGGEFIMTDATARRVTFQMKPKCGRLVSFCAGKDCLHGVKPIIRGRRCALALWFTLDSTHHEQLRTEAKHILEKLTTKHEL